MAAVPLSVALLLLATTRQPHAIAQDGGEHYTLRPRPTIAAIALSIRSRAIQDSRCYLMNGGAVESFYISEDSPVGSVIGTLSINGDPSEDGNISLKLQERSAPVGIVPGTKNLTLLRPLDREEKVGPSNVYVNVRCDRRRTNDPSFIVPVSVRVWDVNDNAPQWIDAPYRARVSEAAAVGARLAPTLRASDSDQPGPHATLHYSVLPGPYSDHFEFPNELESVLVIKKPLDYETTHNVTVVLRASDGGAPPRYNDTTLTVEVLDADDQNPKFDYDQYTAVLPDDAVEGTVLDTLPAAISARDQDAGIAAPLRYSAAGEGGLLRVDRDSGRVAVAGRLLAAPLPVTVVIKAEQVDNPDRYGLCTVVVSSRRGAVRFTRRVRTAAVREDAPPGTVLDVLHTQPETTTQNSLQFYVSDRSFLDKFAINSAGEILLRKPLDYEEQSQYYYQVMVTDGVSNDTASLNITVLNVNEWEPRFRYPQYEFKVEGVEGGAEGGEGGLLPVGRLDVYDGDSPDHVTITLRGADAGMLFINASGELFLRSAALSSLNSSVLHVVATAVDSGQPPRQSSVPVSVVVPPLARRASGATGLAGLAAALAGLALLVLALLAYIYAVRRRAKSASPPPSKASPPALPGSPAPPAGPGAPRLAPALSAGSLLSVSAGASTILANSNSSLDLRDTLPNQGHGTSAGRQSQRFSTKCKIAPAPPTSQPPELSELGLPGAGGPGGPGGLGGPGAALMSDHVGARAAGGRSGVAWPSATIPARVKKLSWDDAANSDDLHAKDSGTHEATNPALADQLNLTVYF